MTSNTTLKVCFATKESLGDSDDDFIELPTTLKHVRPPTLTPPRFAYSTAQMITLENDGSILGLVNGTLSFTQAADCVDMADPRDLQKTEAFLLTANWQQVLMDPTLTSGYYKMCYNPVGGLPTHALLRPPTHIFPTPDYFPKVGLAGSVTPVEFDPTISNVEGDIVVFQKDDCTGAHLVSATTDSSHRTNIANLIAFTDVLMTFEGLLVTCFASFESLGDSQDDFVLLSGGINQRPPPTYTPQRSVTGAEQMLHLLVGTPGDQVAWTTGDETTCFSGTAGPATPYKTIEYDIVAAKQNLQLLLQHLPGDWHMCYKPLNGTWMRVQQCRD